MTLYLFENEHKVKPFRDLYIKKDGMVITYPSQELLAELGYKPLVETECNLEYNHETHYAVATYTERESDILQGWELIEKPALMR